MVRKSYNSGSYVAYTYNAEGSLARLSYGDSTGELASYRFEYDSLGRLIRSAELDADGGTVQRTEHIYDGYNRLSRQSWTLGGKTYTEAYSYDDATDGSMTLFRTTSGQKTKFTYDALRRLQKTTVTDGSNNELYTVARSYYTSGSKTTTRTEYFNYRMPDGSLIAGDRYTYDALGNITGIYQSQSPFAQKTGYTYDDQNQLLTETRYDKGVTYTYKYDTAGNILSATDGTTTHTYTYGDANWRDLLTAVDGRAISYDQIGNPKNWYNGTTYTGLTWENGRQLTSITTGGKTATYTYDADGIRTYKKVGNAEHEYRILNGKVVYEKLGSGSTAKIMIFSYDAQGRPFAVKYSSNNGAKFTNYFYALNQQGDVVKIFRPVAVKDADGNVTGYTEKTYATYTYDAWGKLIGITDRNGDSLMNKQATSSALANRNPLRYRGYYYDVETGFYYLQSRYYDPANHRFINADVYTSTDSSDAVSCNMFAYCGNNPIVRTDPNGEFGLFHLAVAAIGAVVGAVTQVANNIATGESWYDGVAGAAFGGATYNVVALTTGSNLLASAASNAVEAATNEAVSYITGAKKLSWKNVAKSGAAICAQTAVGTAETFAAGHLSSKIIKTNQGWFKPKKLLSCFTGKYARKIWKQTAVQSALELGIDFLKS